MNDQAQIDADAEAALLGGLLVDEDAWDSVSDLFAPELFSDGEHRAVAKAIVTLTAARKPVDSVTVAGAVSTEDARQAAYRLAGSIGTAGNVRHYAEHLRELWARRELKRIASALHSDAEGSAADRLGRVQQALGALQVGRSGKARSMTEMIGHLWEELDVQIREGFHPDRDGLWPTGFGRLDTLIGGFRPGVLAVFAARPSVGKSSFAVALADNLASRRIPVGIFWLEDDWRDLAKRALSRRARISSGLLRHGSFLRPEHIDRVSGSLDGLCNLPIYVDDTHGVTVQDIANRMRRMHREHGVRVFIADHLGEIGIEKSDRWGDRHDLAIGRAARVFRDTAKDLGAAPILMVQMNRQVERRADSEPKLADIDGSGQVEQAARVIGFLSRPSDESGRGTGEFVVKVLKNTTGPTGIATMRWLEDTMSVEDLRVA